MNTNEDQLETRIGSELQQRSEDVWGAPLSLTDVRGRATTIRRRRRIGAALGTAAALAVIAPLAISVGGVLQSDDRVDLTPNPPEVARTVLTLDGLDRGDPPGVEYFTEDGLVLPGDGLQELPDSWQALVPNEAGGGWYALSPSRDEVVDLTDDFERTSARTVTQAFVSSSDRSLVAWVTPESGAQTLHLRSTTDPTVGQVWNFPETPMVQPVDFVGERSILFETLTPNGQTTIGIAKEDGTSTTLAGDFAGAISASAQTGLVALQTRSNPDASGCFGVLDPARSMARPVWETCDYSLGAFSPDGRYVLASGAHQSGMGPTSLSVLEAETGDLVAAFEPKGRSLITFVGVVWESSDTMVGVATEGMTTTIVRLGVDGRLEEVVEPVEGDPMTDVAYYLSEDRRRGY